MLNDADIEMRQLTALGNRVSRLRQRGICAHGWSRLDAATGETVCNHCEKRFASFEAMRAERREVLA